MMGWTPTESPARPGRGLALLYAAVLSVAAGCSGPTEPVPARPRLDLNTVVISVRGAEGLSGTASMLGGFQHVVTGDGSGVHLNATLNGLPFVIHLPGRPGTGTLTLGRWDPRNDHVREDPVEWVGRKPSIAFGPLPTAALGQYTSLPGGTVEIDSIIYPPDLTTNARGRIRGRLRARAVPDSLLAAPNPPVGTDTLEISAEFWVELEDWPDGRATARFVDGAPLGGQTTSELVGSGSVYYFGSNSNDPLLVISLSGTLLGGKDHLEVWLGTRLTAPGQATIHPIEPDQISLPHAWPDQFVAGRLNDRPFGSVIGSITLSSYRTYVYERWGEAVGVASVILGIQSPGSTEVQYTTALISFDVPVAFIVTWL